MPNQQPYSRSYRNVVAALQKSEERYRVLVEGVRRYAIFMLGPTGVILTWNSGVETLLGYSREEFVGKSGALCFKDRDRRAGMFETELADARRLGESMTDRVAMRKDGGELSVHDVVTALHDADGAVIGFAKVTREDVRPTLGERDSGDKLFQLDQELTRTLALLHNEMESRAALETALIAAVEDERRRIGQDLHDDLCQHLAGIAMIAGSLSITLRKTDPTNSESAERIATHLTEAVGLTRSLARGLHPETLISHGLPGALAELAYRVPKGIKYSASETPRIEFEPETALHLYRIAEEAVGNSIRHAGANHISVRLLAERDSSEAVLSVDDDGRGFDQARQAEGMGISNMRYRARIIKATLDLSTDARGTRVRCCVPIPPKAPMS